MSLGVSDGRALGTALRVISTTEESVARAREAVDRVVADVDAACSRFRDDSELARLNASAGREQRVSPLLFSALQESVRAARLTGGALDPTVGSAVKAAGYDVDFASVAADGAPIRLVARPVPGWERIRLREAGRLVFIPEHVDVDLGSLGKALAADIAADAALRAVGDGGVLVSLGGDIAVAGDPPDEGWQVQVSDSSDAPIDAGAETVSIRAGGLATSSTAARRWRRGDVELHHIVDPATGLPAAGPWRTASVCGGTCVDANIASTAAIVLGDRAVRWLEDAGMPARLVRNDGAVVRIGGWPVRVS